MSPTTKPKPKISWVEGYFMVAFALAADLVSLIPVVNIFVDVLVIPAYQLFYLHKGIRGLATLSVTIIEFIIEIIPGVSALPAITAGAIIIIVLDRMEATKLGKMAVSKVESAVTLKGGTKAAKQTKPSLRPPQPAIARQAPTLAATGNIVSLRPQGLEGVKKAA